MDRSKKNLSAVRGDAPVKLQGSTKHPRGFFGTDPNAKSPWGNNKDAAVDLREG